MKITTKVDVDCASGFYCRRNGVTKCARLKFEDNARPYCEIFYFYLETDRNENILKTQACLLAEREERLKR